MADSEGEWDKAVNGEPVVSELEVQVITNLHYSFDYSDRRIMNEKLKLVHSLNDCSLMDPWI